MLIDMVKELFSDVSVKAKDKTGVTCTVKVILYTTIGDILRWAHQVFI